MAKAKKIKVVKKSTLKHKADQLWSLAVRKRDGACMFKGKGSVRCGGALQGGHIEGRQNHSIRWALVNGLAMCAGHNKWFKHNEDELKKLVAKHYPKVAAWVKKHVVKGQSMQVKLHEYREIITLLEQGNKEVCVPCLRIKGASSTNNTTRPASVRGASSQ